GHAAGPGRLDWPGWPESGWPAAAARAGPAPGPGRPERPAPAADPGADPADAAAARCDAAAVHRPVGQEPEAGLGDGEGRPGPDPEGHAGGSYHRDPAGGPGWQADPGSGQPDHPADAVRSAG